jgi:hypothetical protein
MKRCLAVIILDFGAGALLEQQVDRDLVTSFDSQVQSG